MKVLGCYPGRAPEHKDPGFYIVGIDPCGFWASR